MDGSQVYNWDGTMTTFSPQPNNAKDYFERQFTVDNTLSFSGGNESTTFRLSLQDMRNQSMLPTHEMTRQGINLRASHQVSDRLTAEGKVNYIRQEVHNRPALADDQENVMYQFRGMPRNTQLSNLRDYTIGLNEQLVGYSEDINQEGFPRHWSNATHTEQPYWIVNNIINEDTRERVMGFVRVNYDFTDWLSAQVRAETDFYVDKWHNHAAIGTRTPGQGDGTLGDQVHRFREDNAEFLLTGERSVTDNLTITANIGGNYKRDFFNNTNYSGEQLAVENLYVISNAQIQNTGYDLQETEIQSLYAFGQFNWRDFWYVDWSVRNDWASTLPSDNNSFAYPSIGTNFIFTDAFDMESDILSYGSVRANWAQAGSSADPYQLSGTYGLVANPHQGQPGAAFQDNIPFIDLQNELTTSVEVGADLRFFEGRLRVDGNWYSNSTINQILIYSGLNGFWLF
ncbi:MAG: TonB-dependent receptor [Balneolaceae bacterium]|nr:TonB-dependent receptor [Balneolaceae bacterium]